MNLLDLFWECLHIWYLYGLVYTTSYPFFFGTTWPQLCLLLLSFMFLIFLVALFVCPFCVFGCSVCCSLVLCIPLHTTSVFLFSCFGGWFTNRLKNWTWAVRLTLHTTLEETPSKCGYPRSTSTGENCYAKFVKGRAWQLAYSCNYYCSLRGAGCCFAASETFRAAPTNYPKEHHHDEEPPSFWTSEATSVWSGWVMDQHI